MPSLFNLHLSRGWMGAVKGMCGWVRVVKIIGFKERKRARVMKQMDRRRSDCEQQTHRQTLTLRGDRTHTHTHTHTLTFSIYEVHQVTTLHSENSRQFSDGWIILVPPISGKRVTDRTGPANFRKKESCHSQRLLMYSPPEVLPQSGNWILSSHTQLENRRRCEKSQLPLHFNF